MNSSINIFCPRDLPDTLINEAKKQGIYIDCHQLLEITYKGSKEMVHELIRSRFPLVFTSKHALNSLLEKLDPSDVIDNKVYGITGTTSSLINDSVLQLTGHQTNGFELAKMIVSDRIQQIIFLCGDIHRQELPDHLEKNGVTVIKEVIYEKRLLSFPPDFDYQGYLFFSPTQVDAFFQSNQPDPFSPIFCIGETTADHLRSKGMRSVSSAGKSHIRSVVSMALNYYKTQHHV